MKIVIIGASGFLGTKLMNILSKNNKVIGTYSKNKKENLVQLDATNEQEVKEFLLKNKPDLVIDTIALTSSVACEKDPALCKLLNYQTAKNIVEACKLINVPMIFMSSTYIFDGKSGDYSESDVPIPLNEYGKMKILAEQELLKYPKSIILRVDIMYGFNGKNEKNGVFGGSILTGNEVKLREPNQMRTPVFVEDVSRAILFLAEKKQNGIFHVAGKDKVKMMDFLKSLEKIVRNDTKIVEDMDKTSVAPVKAPFNATFNTSKMEKLGFKFSSFEEGLKELRKQYQA